MRPLKSALVSAFAVGSVLLLALPLARAQRGAPAPDGAGDFGTTLSADVRSLRLTPPATSSASTPESSEPVLASGTSSATSSGMSSATEATAEPEVAPVVLPIAPFGEEEEAAITPTPNEAPVGPTTRVGSAAPAAAAVPVTPVAPNAPATPNAGNAEATAENDTTSANPDPRAQAAADARAQAKAEAKAQANAAAQAKALREYYTNGAAMAAVPTDGPGAEYFTNAAALLTVPSSVIPEGWTDLDTASP